MAYIELKSDYDNLNNFKLLIVENPKYCNINYYFKIIGNIKEYIIEKNIMEAYIGKENIFKIKEEYKENNSRKDLIEINKILLDNIIEIIKIYLDDNGIKYFCYCYLNVYYFDMEKNILNDIFDLANKNVKIYPTKQYNEIDLYTMNKNDLQSFINYFELKLKHNENKINFVKHDYTLLTYKKHEKLIKLFIYFIKNKKVINLELMIMIDLENKITFENILNKFSNIIDSGYVSNGNRNYIILEQFNQIDLNNLQSLYDKTYIVNYIYDSCYDSNIFTFWKPDMFEKINIGEKCISGGCCPTKAIKLNYNKIEKIIDCLWNFY